MTDKRDDDPSAWLAAQVAGSSEETAATDEAPTERSARIDGDLPLRRPVLPTGGGYSWGLTPSSGAHSEETDGGTSTPTPTPTPTPTAPSGRPFFPQSTPQPAAEPVVHSEERHTDPLAPAVSDAVDAPPAPAAASAAPEATEGAASIPTIEQVLDSPSPRRAAREAAAREAALVDAARRNGSADPVLAQPAAPIPPVTTPAVPTYSAPTETPVQTPVQTPTAAARPRAPQFDLPTPQFFDNGATAAQVSAPQTAGGPNPPIFFPLPQPAEPGAAQKSATRAGREAKKPRNQRVVLIVLIGLVVVLGIVVAFNFLL